MSANFSRDAMNINRSACFVFTTENPAIDMPRIGNLWLTIRYQTTIIMHGYLQSTFVALTPLWNHDLGSLDPYRYYPTTSRLLKAVKDLLPAPPSWSRHYQSIRYSPADAFSVKVLPESHRKFDTREAQSPNCVYASTVKLQSSKF